VVVTPNPADGRSCLVALTSTGVDELGRLTKVGLERFASFVSEWGPAQVRMLTGLLERLQHSMAAASAQEQRGR
jgi:DNA-binding MarR family transcriptional regulator